jgi:RNA polymerase sigma-70 factor, ECF subfamily
MNGRATEEAQLSDEALIRRYLETGDRELFATLVRRHQNTVFAMCVRIVGSREKAEEVAQDVFIAVYRNLDKFRGDARFRTWLYRVVVNHCKNKNAYLARRHSKRHESLDAGREREDGEVKRELPSPNPGPEQATLAKQRRALLEKGLARLGEDHRTVIVMRDLQGMPYEEIAQTLGVAPGTVKSRLNRARNELKDRVGRMLAELEPAT